MNSRPATSTAGCARSFAALAEGGPPDGHLVAHHVRTSVRTLQRRLRGRGQTYAGILQQTRCQAAEQMLTESARKISDVARALGCSDPGHFARLPARTGLTPREFRRRARADPRTHRQRPRVPGPA
jgi:AraC-like DNA-binding protein